MWERERVRKHLVFCGGWPHSKDIVWYTSLILRSDLVKQKKWKLITLILFWNVEYKFHMFASPKWWTKTITLTNIEDIICTWNTVNSILFCVAFIVKGLLAESVHVPNPHGCMYISLTSACVGTTSPPCHRLFKSLNSTGGMNTFLPGDIHVFGVVMMVVESAVQHVGQSHL